MEQLPYNILVALMCIVLERERRITQFILLGFFCDIAMDEHVHVLVRVT